VRTLNGTACNYTGSLAEALNTTGTNTTASPGQNRRENPAAPPPPPPPLIVLYVRLEVMTKDLALLNASVATDALLAALLSNLTAPPGGYLGSISNLTLARGGVDPDAAASTNAGDTTDSSSGFPLIVVAAAAAGGLFLIVLIIVLTVATVS
jgi:hypothetical protein